MQFFNSNSDETRFKSISFAFTFSKPHLLSFCLCIRLSNPRQQPQIHVHSQQRSYTRQPMKHISSKRNIETRRLTNNSKREICPIQQRRLLVLAHHIGAHMKQFETARRSPHKRNRSKRQPGQFSRSRRASFRSQLRDEIRCQRELDETLDVEEDLEPGLVRVVGEEGVAGGGDVEFAQREEEMQGSRGGLIERFGVKGDEVEG